MPVLFACLLGCSSSSTASSNATGFLRCNGVPGSDPDDGECAVCEQNTCATTDNAMLNACTSYGACLAACTGCKASCTSACYASASSDCKTAIDNLDACGKTQCASSCVAADGGTK